MRSSFHWRSFPSQDLVVYVEFDGLDRPREAWKKTALFRVLNETTTGAMYEAMVPRVLDLIVPESSGVRVSGKELQLAVCYWRDQVSRWESTAPAGLGRRGASDW